MGGCKLVAYDITKSHDHPFISLRFNVMFGQTRVSYLLSSALFVSRLEIHGFVLLFIA
jgi:hypothetical protein